ncbi:hypothetical protein Rhal01_00595 [Rubritalea halochordaticola]|uniref:Squalene cyclase C-terminal domain-containing protein n=1 Tax=Rubritalea halochordaticola TaxID=714537 RepID=A0ABP9UYK6_9BACT
MKTLAALSALALTLNATAQEKNYLSLQLEMKHAIDKGNAYLKSVQKENGHWKNEDIPAYTALAITAAMRAPSLEVGKTPEHIQKGYTWLLSKQKDTGAIFGRGLANYNTSTSIMALTASGNPEYKDEILRARRFIINLQQDWDNKGELDNKYDGGIGYGGSYTHSDLSNTYLSIEALELSKQYALDAKNETGKPEPELDWDAAIKFVSRIQNLEETNDQPGIGNDGSFVYFPGNSKAGTEKQADGRETLRGYGSMSYAGLLSLIYADLDHKDPRVVAVKKWLNDNYTLEENPGLGEQGLYYYYQAMAKALTAAEIDTLKTKDGVEHDWRKELATKILNAQREDGSWINENARWWENEPELVTAYAVLTLEQIYYSIPEPQKKQN